MHRYHDKLSLCRFILDGKNEKCAAHFCCQWFCLSPGKHHTLLHPLDKHNSLRSCAVTTKVARAFVDRCIDHSRHHIETNPMNSIQTACSNQALVDKL